LTTSIVNVCDEREWCTDYGTPNWVLVYFNSVIKRVKQCCCTLILLPKSTLNANLTATKRFFTNEWMTIDSADDSKISNRTINTNRISNRTYDSKSNRITKRAVPYSPRMLLMFSFAEFYAMEIILLYTLLPEKNSHGYNLRHRRHDRTLVSNHDQRNFIDRQLHKHS